MANFTDKSKSSAAGPATGRETDEEAEMEVA